MRGAPALRREGHVVETQRLGGELQDGPVATLDAGRRHELGDVLERPAVEGRALPVGERDQPLGGGGLPSMSRRSRALGGAAFSRVFMAGHIASGRRARAAVVCGHAGAASSRRGREAARRHRILNAPGRRHRRRVQG